MGHVFGLPHVCTTTNDFEGDSNTMTSIVDVTIGRCRGLRGLGLRNVWFNQEQVLLIKLQAQEIIPILEAGDTPIGTSS